MTTLGLPVMTMIRDNNGCKIRTKKGHFYTGDERDAWFYTGDEQDARDLVGVPRLVWYIPPGRHDEEFGRGWCGLAVQSLSYAFWQQHAGKHDTRDKLQRTLSKWNRQYPWEKKHPRAIWRGSTYFDNAVYNNCDLDCFHDTPRSRLVQKSMDHPEWMDAAFTQVVGKIFVVNETLIANETRVVKWIKFNDFMKYKAIIDIDGMKWSSRFGNLLCFNSVVIKIEPDYVEEFYKQLQPMVHYVPATLDNLTETVKYVMDDGNEEQIKEIVANAQGWCLKTMTGTAMRKEAAHSLNAYRKSLELYGAGVDADLIDIMLNHSVPCKF